MKSGTTSFHNYISQHPQLYPSRFKEIHFFDNPTRFAKGEQWYRAHFPYTDSLEADSVVFEASPRYIFDPHAPERIHKTIPDVKMIAVLRNPVDRALSHYFTSRRRGIESLPIHEALYEEEERLAPFVDAGAYNSKEYMHYSYKLRGLYKQQLDRYLNLFDRNQLLVLSSDELFTAPHACLERVYSFLDVDPNFEVKDLKPRNTARNRRDTVDDEIYEYLGDYFRPHNQELYELIGEDYNWE